MSFFINYIRFFYQFFKRTIRDISFLYINGRAAMRIGPYPGDVKNGVLVRSVNILDIRHIIGIYREEWNEALPFRNILLLILFGRWLGYVAVKEDNGEMVGFSYYYFNKRDIVQKTIHWAYMGIKSGNQGMGIGRLLMESAICRLSVMPHLAGISSRASVDNEPSVHLQMSAGFEIIEKYYDPGFECERYYFIKKMQGV